MIRDLRALAAFAKAAYRQRTTYPVANLAGLFTNSLFLLFRAYVIEACYRERAVVGDLTVSAAVGYVAVTQALLVVSPQWGQVGLATDVRSGQVAVELLRPTDFVSRFFAGRFGVAAYYATRRMAPLLLFAWLLGLLPLPTPADAALFAVSVVVAVVVANALLFLVEVSSFWLESEKGVRYVVLGFSILPSGITLPLSWFPAPVRALFLCTPYPYTLHLPTTLWLGTATPDEVARGLVVQLCWAIGLIALCRWAFARGTRRLVFHGG